MLRAEPYKIDHVRCCLLAAVRPATVGDGGRVLRRCTFHGERRGRVGVSSLKMTLPPIHRRSAAPTVGGMLVVSESGIPIAVTAGSLRLAGDTRLPDFIRQGARPRLPNRLRGALRSSASIHSSQHRWDGLFGLRLSYKGWTMAFSLAPPRLRPLGTSTHRDRSGAYRLYPRRLCLRSWLRNDLWRPIWNRLDTTGSIRAASACKSALRHRPESTVEAHSLVCGARCDRVQGE